MSDRELIEAAFADLSLLDDAREAVERTIALLDRGEVRVAKKSEGEWAVNRWVKEAIMLYFRMRPLSASNAGPFEYHDKIETKHNLAEAGVRVVPPGTIRYGAFCEPGVVVMPGYVNIGAWVGHHDRHVGNRRFMRPDRTKRAPVGRRRHRRRSGAAGCTTCDHRGRSLHR